MAWRILMSGSFSRSAVALVLTVLFAQLIYCRVWSLAAPNAVQDLRRNIFKIASTSQSVLSLASWKTEHEGRFLLLSGSKDSVVRLHQIQATPDAEGGLSQVVTFSEVLGVEGHTGPVFALASWPSCNMFASGSFEKEIRVWSLSFPENGKETNEYQVNLKQVLGPHTGWVKDVKLLSSQSEHGHAPLQGMVSVGCNFIKLWSYQGEAGNESSNHCFDHIGDLEVHGDILCLVADGKRLFAGKVDGSIQSWPLSHKDAEQGKEEATYPLQRQWRPSLCGLAPGAPPAAAAARAHRGRVVQLAAAGGRLYSVGYDGYLRCWQPSAGQPENSAGAQRPRPSEDNNGPLELVHEVFLGGDPDDWALSLHCLTRERGEEGIGGDGEEGRAAHLVAVGTRRGRLHLLSSPPAGGGGRRSAMARRTPPGGVHLGPSPINAITSVSVAAAPRPGGGFGHRGTGGAAGDFHVVPDGGTAAPGSRISFPVEKLVIDRQQTATSGSESVGIGNTAAAATIGEEKVGSMGGHELTEHADHQQHVTLLMCGLGDGSIFCWPLLLL